VVVKRLNLILIFLLIVSQSQKLTGTQDYRWHSYAYSGYAWSRFAGFVNPDPITFQVDSIAGDDNVLRNVPFVGLALHRRLCAFLEFGFSYDSYAVFAYQKYHLISPSDAEGSIELLYPEYQRQFSLQHQAVMCESFLKFPEQFEVIAGNLLVYPVFGVAVGVGINNMMGFQTITYDFVSDTTDVTTIANNRIVKSLAWRFEFAINFASANSNLDFGFSYRYEHGGKFASGQKYMLNDVINQGSIYNLSAWTGVLKTHQLKLYINVNFD